VQTPAAAHETVVAELIGGLPAGPDRTLSGPRFTLPALAKFAQLWLVIGHLYKPATAARLADGIVAFAGAG
jgi:hypothetical protein